MRQKIKINIFLETIEIRNSLVKCQNKSNTQASRCNQLAFDIKIMRYEYYGRICDSWFLWVSYRNSSRTLTLDTLLSISSTKLLFNFISWSFWLIGGLQKNFFYKKKARKLALFFIKLSRRSLNGWLPVYIFGFLPNTS